MTKLWKREKSKQYETENVGFQNKQAFVGFIESIPRLNRKCKVYVTKKRGFVHPIEIIPEIIELISAGIVVIHTKDAYYLLCITSANERPVIFFPEELPEEGMSLYGNQLMEYSKDDMDLKLERVFTNIVTKIVYVSNASICYTANTVYLVLN